MELYARTRFDRADWSDREFTARSASGTLPN
jgi:hypothetical protein